MDFLTQLWDPIVVSAVIVWIASAIVWTAMPHRKAEWSEVPDEDAFRAFLSDGGFKPGYYMFPCCCDHAKMKDPAVKERMAKGPFGVLNIWTHRRSMGVSMAESFLLNLVVSFFVAYVAWHALQPGADYLKVFQITGVSAFMAYSLGQLGGGIWFGMTARSMVYTVIEGLVYGGLTAGVFGWLWPTISQAVDAVEAMPG